MIAKIRKLLNLARNGAASANEAAVAMAKAQRLAAEHGISLTEIPADDAPGTGLTHTSIPVRRDLASRLASVMVGAHFGVSVACAWSGRRSVVYIVGTRDQAELATYVFVYLHRSLHHAWRYRENRRLRDQESFMRGFCHAVGKNLPRVFPQHGLALSASHYIDTKLIRQEMTVTEAAPLKKSISREALHAGFRAGDQAGIRNAITAPPIQPELNLA